MMISPHILFNECYGNYALRQPPVPVGGVDGLKAAMLAVAAQQSIEQRAPVMIASEGVRVG